MANKIAQIRFSNKDKGLFFSTLKKRVDAYFIENNISQHANASMVIKSIVFISGYILPFIFLLMFQPVFWVSMLLWSVMGLSLAGIGMSVMHDANHGAYSSKKWVNTLMGHTLNLVGGAVINWKLQHNILHHTYTNIVHVDDDIADRLVLRFSPHTNVKKYHQIQFIYAFLFYGLLTFYWVLLKDFVQFVRYTKNGVNTNSTAENVKVLSLITINKIVYFFTLLGVPALYFSIPFWEVATGFMVMHYWGGLILTVVFQLAHTVEGTAHPLPDANGNIENDWAIHQLNTTVNFSRNNKLISWYVGGLNYQVEHHLFPKICHVHYPMIAPIVKQTAEEFGIQYMENESFFEALQSHINTLKRFGKLPDINEAIA